MKPIEIKHSNRPEPQVMVPTEITTPKGKCYTGKIRGYYVRETNIYNIVPDDAQIDNSKVTCIGNILNFNVFKALEECYTRNIKYLKIDIDNNLTPAERFHTKLKQQEENKLPDGTLHSSPILTMPYLEEKLHDFISEVDSRWLYSVLLEAINKSNCTLPSEREIIAPITPLELLGYWENNELHFIQLETLVEVKIEPYALKLDIFSRNTGILESSIMIDKSALFIGCGSVGSLVAVELAKAGVGKFMLVDNDIFGYHNICRHQCGIYDVGRYKTDAVADRILQINPYATIVKKNCIIQDVNTDEIFAFCNHDSIVIGGADNREGDLYANQFAIEIGMPFISIGCWERAFAGEIFYCLPSGMPTYEDFLDAVGHVSGRVTQNRRFYTTEEDLEKVSFEPGISVDVNFVTIIAVKMALDLLNRNNSAYTQRLIPHLTQYTLICNTNDPQIGGEQAEIFSYPLQVTTSILVPYKNKN